MLTITGREKAIQLLAKERFDFVVSIRDVKDLEVVEIHHSIPSLSLVFEDDIRETQNSFTDSQARVLVSALQTIPRGAKVLIHCGRGLSRSTAVGLVLLGLWHGFDDPSLGTQLLGIQPKAIPNDLVVAKCEAALGLTHQPLTHSLIDWLPWE